MTIKRIFSKTTVDILLVIGFFLSMLSSRHSAASSWGSFHCMVSMAWYALTLVHIGQHWRFTKALAKWKVIKRNKITFLTVVVFVLMTISIFTFIGGVNNQNMHVHHAIAHIFWIAILIHAITKAKRFVYLFKK